MIIIDAYNVIFKWKMLDDYKTMEIVRNKFVDIISNYQGFINEEIIIVFDSKLGNSKQGQVFPNNIEVVFTNRAQTADTYIERFVYSHRDPGKITVVSSDRLECMIAADKGAMIMSPSVFKTEIQYMIKNWRNI